MELALLVLVAACLRCRADFVAPPQPSTSQRSFSERATRLPCLYRVEEGEQVVQVTWTKELPGGAKDQVITAHYLDGHTEFGRYAGRVRFESSRPTENSALLILSTEESDGGRYTCHISTFPNGNFERRITLTVWVLPISSLDPVVLVEGESFRVAASCRAVGRPPPRLSWDTELPGRSQNRSKEGGSVSSHFSLHPLRGMNGQQLDCLVWHPGLERPRRIHNRLVVQYPPDAVISAGSGDWFVGLENAELECSGGGSPKPQNITWTRRGAALPDGSSVAGGTLVFGRALRANDSGVYECVARNPVGAGTSEYLMTVKESPRRTGGVDNLLLVLLGAAAGALVLVLLLVVLLLNRHHRHQNKRLEMELSEKTEEIQSFSRQASFRRLNSVSTDPRVQREDESLMRVDSRMRSSQMSLERPVSTLSGRWGPRAEVDELGRPAVWHDGRESLRGAELEERRRRVESYLKSSNMSLDSGLPSSLVPLKAQQDQGVGPREGDPPQGEDWAPPPPPPPAEEHEEEEEEEGGSSYQLSEALTNHFYYSNGVLRPRPHSNAILLHPRGQII
ncbi:nectin-4 isoform X1 [Pseudoliparis swirei]|uniref:nectin-4 isoform X1 n=1 Tax=Pseudoliparis swirei TaxID=2059687 RepID=UPI0024BE013E|nr:nectin-4 isoform X1 [Pseudoliparis swirei]XP_056266585.1 nectin-4 isoform X1 [Pseudoliparis swirei]